MNNIIPDETRPLFITRRQAAEILGVTRKTIDARIKQGRIKAIKLGDTNQAPVLIPIRELEAFTGTTISFPAPGD